MNTYTKQEAIDLINELNDRDFCANDFIGYFDIEDGMTWPAIKYLAECIREDERSAKEDNAQRDAYYLGHA